MKRVFCFLSLLAALTACAPKIYNDPLAVMTSREKSLGERKLAAEQAAREMPSDPKRIAALNTLVWGAQYPPELRIYAIDELIKIDEAAFRKTLATRIVLIENAQTLDHVVKVAVARKWDDFTPVLVRRYALKERGVPDKDRYERPVLEKLNPGKSIEQIVFDVFANGDDKVPYVQQVAAWELLNRLSNKERLIELLAQAPSTTPLVIDLKAAGEELHTLPRNKEGVLWLSYLRDPKRKDFWDAAKAKVARLTPEQRVGLELRHLPFLIRADKDILATTQASLITDIRGELAGAEHHLKTPTFDGQDKDHAQRFEEFMDKLSWGDLIVIKMLIVAVRNENVIDALFDQAKADNADTSTEFGGGMLFKGDTTELVAKPFKPLIRYNDTRFIPPPELIEALYTNAAHYHFHAQSFHNSDYAGPGRGDVEFADRVNLNCLVFTYINPDSLNVDYYQPGGAIVDLGTIRR